MKTSSSQFDMMVTFMEQHGDISKPSSHARGKITCLKYWEELTHLLNSDGSGESKTVEKWKKGVHIQPSVSCGQGIPSPQPNQFVEVPQDRNESAPATSPIPQPAASLLLPSLTRALSSPPLMFVEEEIQNTQSWNQPGPSTTYNAPRSPPQARSPSIIPPYVQARLEDNTGMLSPTRPSSQVHIVQAEPSQAGQSTPRHSRHRRRRGSPRRPVRPARTEEAAQQFLQAEEFWRNFKIDQHRDYVDLKREQNRIREMELNIQREWQAVGLRALETLNKLVDKYCRDS
uniref:Regulatory protein zeste n=1 Tax=Heliothis virescens TaxID=7102 RepID=A0A2A4JMX9_HELVI